MSILTKVLGTAIEGAVRGALDRGGPLDAGAIARDATARCQADPVAINELNAEAPHQSRVVVGSTVSLVATIVVAGAHLYDMWQSGTVDVTLATAELAAIWGAAFALYGRLKGGLRPLFTRGA